jgi:hypothetical protein
LTVVSSRAGWHVPTWSAARIFVCPGLVEISPEAFDATALGVFTPYPAFSA